MSKANTANTANTVNTVNTANIANAANTAKKVKSKKSGVNLKVKKIKAKKSIKNVYKQKQTRIEILQTLAEKTQLPKVQVEKVFMELVNLISGHLCKKGSGEISIPFTGIKIKRIKKKASKARKMISPLLGEEVSIAGKPARNAVKVIVLKTLKDMVVES